jgi:glyoxylase-like metal-dependent hydrolase (beta-lactamase superfamily II)
MASYSIPGLEMPPVQVDTWLDDGQEIEIVGRPVQIRHVPGHSPGSILFWFKEDGFAVSGDAIFCGSIGRTDFPGCSFEQLAYSIKKNIYSLPDETILYPGHGPETSVKGEALTNPFVQRD